mgnify:CR=1 FL=1|jgi:Ku protein, prokaryotic
MAASTSKRVLWKGAISFGLVHIPIALHSAVQNQSVDFDWLDRRSMEPVGYKRINKITGKEIERENIVKGIEYSDGEYVILEPEEIAAAYPRTTQTIEIEAFVSLDAIPFVYLERPYYVAPINKGGKVYGLLREVLAESHLAGLAKVVIQTKQHLALLFPCGPVLILNLLRWGDEVRDWSALNLPSQSKKELGLSEKELKMARELIGDMTIDWEPERFTNSFREQIMQLVQEKVEAGETTEVTQPEPEEADSGGARIYDLTEMLQKSLKGRNPRASQSEPDAAKQKSRNTEDNEGRKTSKSQTDPNTARKSAKSRKTASASKTSRTAGTVSTKTQSDKSVSTRSAKKAVVPATQSAAKGAKANSKTAKAGSKATGTARAGAKTAAKTSKTTAAKRSASGGRKAA